MTTVFENIFVKYKKYIEVKFIENILTIGTSDKEILSDLICLSYIDSIFFSFIQFLLAIYGNNCMGNYVCDLDMKRNISIPNICLNLDI